MCNYSESYAKLKIIIDCLQDTYDDINSKFKYDIDKSLNFKKILVKDLTNESEAYKYILAYQQFLNEKSFEIVEKIEDLNFIKKPTSRIKNIHSIEYKINNYKSKKHENGNIPVLKCFNDLFGARIILSQALTHKEIKKFIRDNYQDKYKCIDSSKGDYVATHIYFKNSNYNLPWELQVWNECSEERNIRSHRVYKQEYVEWEKRNKREILKKGVSCNV